jgi:hypothetical protein
MEAWDAEPSSQFLLLCGSCGAALSVLVVRQGEGVGGSWGCPWCGAAMRLLGREDEQTMGVLQELTQAAGNGPLWARMMFRVALWWAARRVRKVAQR